MTDLPTSNGNEIRIRASALTLWPDCERRAAARLFWSIIREKGYELRQTPIHVGAPIGTATHAGAAHGLKNKILTGELTSLDEATEVALVSFDEELDKDQEIDWRPKEAGNRDEGQRQVMRMLAMIHIRVSPTIRPVAVEDRLEADIGDGFILSGQRDLYAVELIEDPPDIISHDANGVWKIRDLKTGAGSGSHMPQTGAYGLLARTHGDRVDGADIIHLPRVPLRHRQPEPVIIPVDIEEAEQSAERTYERAKSSLVEFMETGDHHAFLANPFSKLCNDKCPAWGTPFCKEHLEFE